MERTPRPNEIYQHFKGNLYKVITLATHSETGESMVVYQALYGDFPVFVRPLEMFVGKVDHDKYPQVKAEYRFTLASRILGQGAAGEEPLFTAPEEERGMNGDSFRQEGNPWLEEEEAVLDPLLVKFLDADTYEDKLNILVGLQSRITDDMLNTIAVSLDLELEEGELEERYQTLKNCLITLEKYECNRLR